MRQNKLLFAFLLFFERARLRQYLTEFDVQIILNEKYKNLQFALCKYTLIFTIYFVLRIIYH